MRQLRSVAAALVVLAVASNEALSQSRTRTEIYDLQERCGKRALEMYEKDYPKDEQKGIVVYESHYNERLNKCFSFYDDTQYIRNEGKTTKIRQLILFDVNANKTYGSFSSVGCEVLEKKCKTEQEFRALIRPYMED